MPTGCNRDERQALWIVVSVLLTMGIALGMYRYGLPALANTTVRQLPVAVFEQLSAGALETLDADWLSPSALEPSRQEAPTERFDTMVETLQD